MKMINPLGRDLTTNAPGAQPYACMCSNLFSNARGDDSCFHCGCSCSDSDVNAGNSSKAFRTVRKSGSVE
ncbi:hypothetical protein Curi_c00550 [Gottschalkia acidurici 9a]|uniref:Bacteriocin n=1 Tax=Gottschalkia acidurici (strain ATCC 7906 / DSM 604 / BCRC 14475 / CIP 104303 / KCTC 5404 / NCIMB 10678 / 9a) TaxID=1128398 RepID=K0AXG5_GOTA9|nr:Apre_1838 family putative sactipeptide bacteriocin [Gottschalkia acidurici]AFS77136.1 hypothetical protein Curi_c00550 [Gottschalkia acidurici 9a]